jgi:hypothetical protein
MAALLYLCLYMLTSVAHADSKANLAKRLFDEGEQFPPGSEHNQLPSLVCISIHTGSIAAYSYLDLTLESMRWNPNVDFVVLNVIPDDESISEAYHEVDELLPRGRSIDNFRVVQISSRDLSTVINKKLNLNVNLDASWYYKMCDYKPTLAYLFPELLLIPPERRRFHGRLSEYRSRMLGINKHSDVNAKQNLQKYTFWGWADLDLVWGNISRYAYLFQGQYPIVPTGCCYARGMAHFQRNMRWTNE